MRLIDADVAIEELTDRSHQAAKMVGTDSPFWEGLVIARRIVNNLPTIQPELTDEQAIAHLQSSGWMQRHDKEMYESGLKEQLADDSDSYDSLLPTVQPEERTETHAAIDATHGRIFQEIVVEYPSYYIYPEYKGKPYFSIKYTENGQGFIGYGTYKPEVLSEYMKEYFIPPAHPEYRLDEWCHDCKEYDQENHCCPRFNRVIREALKDAQPEPKVACWIKHETPDGGEQYECSRCGVLWEFSDGSPEDNEAYFCPKCGAKMKGATT